MSGSTASQITGDDIISELIRNAEAGRFKLRYTVLVPCIFNVYLHLRDYELIQPIAGMIQAEAMRALQEHLANLNRPRRAHLFGKQFTSPGEPRPEYKILEKQWVIEFHGDQEERLRPGEIEIYSELGSTRPKDFGAGAMTTFITRHDARDPAIVDGSTERAHPPVLAKLRYQDSGKDKTFVMTSDEISIGRGGKAVWVDLKLEGPPDVSREHCRIRRDPAAGTFFIRDLSQFGTAVNGASLPRNGEPDRSREVLLPSPAKITLADVCTLDFQAEPSQ